MTRTKRIYLISITAAIAGFLFGFDTGVISGAILFINKEFALTHFQTECVISSVLLGAMAGASVSGRLSDLVGRKTILLITAFIFCLGTLICSISLSLFTLITGRLILGVAVGCASFAAPLYLAELAPKNQRGFLVSLNQLSITIGILLSYIVDYQLAAYEAWRFMLLFGLLPSMLLLLGTALLPESPRFLASLGKLQQAKKILAMIRQPDEIETELQAFSKHQKTAIQFSDLISNKRLLKLFSLGIILAITQQITGINTIIYYAPTIFNMAGFHTSSAILVTAIVGIVNVLFTLIALPLIDKVGRRKLLSIGLSGMLTSLIILGFTFQHAHLNGPIKYLTLISMMLYIACFAISLGPVVFVLLSEIFPQRIRGFGMSIAMAANWSTNFIVAVTFLSLIESIGTANTFYLYAAISIGALIFILKYVPETKDHALEQIEHQFNQGVRIRDLGNIQGIYNVIKK